MKNYNRPIFVPHRGCPYDCVFCNQRRITGSTTEVSAEDVRSIIEDHLRTLPKNGARIEVAFFGGSFTGIPIEEQ
ncbi:MAG: radical SAM protein, partial [Clostridiales bacterium]|nr:radical SAM protein [Clostridiales bacterium]